MWFPERENAEWLLKCLSIGRAAENRFFFLISFSKLLSNLAYKPAFLRMTSICTLASNTARGAVALRK